MPMPNPLAPPGPPVEDGAPRFTAGSFRRSIDAATKDLSLPPIMVENDKTTARPVQRPMGTTPYLEHPTDDQPEPEPRPKRKRAR